MAEVLAVASSVAGLLSLTIEVYSISSRFISCIKHASSAVLEVQRELKSLKSILTELDDILEDDEADKLLANRKSALSAMQDAEEYREALQKLQAKLDKEASKTGFSAKLKSFAWPFNEERTQSILEVLRRYVSVFGQALSIDSFWIGAEILKEVKFLGEEKKEKLKTSSLERLSPAKYDMLPKQHDFFSKRVGTTGEWLLEHSVFKEWVDKPLPAILWCSGGPGTGKTILSSIVVDYLNRKNTPDGTASAVIFCDYKDQIANTTLNILGNIAKQLIQGRPSGFKALEELYDRLRLRSAQAVIKDYEALILSLCNNSDDTYIVIDALDELQSEHRKTLFPIIRSFQQNAIKVLVTSRPHIQDIERAFRDQTNLIIQASDEDVQQLVRTVIDQNEDLLDTLEDDEKLKEQIISTMIDAANGMILLPVLQLKHLNGLFSKAQIRRALNTMPKDILGMYSQTIDRIKQQGQSRSKLAFTVLGWISLSKRPLLISELRHALAIEFRDDEDRKRHLDSENLIRQQLLLDVCAGLVSLESESNTVRLVHFTAQEYLNQNVQTLFPHMPAQIAGTCLTYLLLDAFESGPCLKKDQMDERVEIFQFLEYASVYWADHVRGPLEAQFLDLILEFIKCDKKLCASAEARNRRDFEFFRWCNLFGYIPSDFKPLHCAASLGLDTIIKTLLNEGASPREVDGTFKTPVHWAAWRGYTSSLEILLDTGVDIHLASEDKFLLLETAVDQGHEKVALLLLDRGFDIDRQGFGKNTALITAALMGRDNLVTLLLERGAKCDVKNEFGETALFKAAINGHTEIVKTLLNRGMDVKQANACGNTPLHCACFAGRTVVVKELLEAGAEVNMITTNGTTALHMAASEGHEEVVKMLVQKGASLEAKTSADRKSHSPVSKEAGRCIPRMVSLDTCGRGATPLFEAVLHNHKDIVTYLLQQGADFTTTDSTGQTLLMAAAMSTYHDHDHFWKPEVPLDVMRSSALSNAQALLSHGVEVNAVCNTKCSALHLAASDGFLDLVQLLVKEGADINAKNVDEEIPLHWAADYGKAESVEYFITQGADVHAKNNNGRTPFHLAASGGNVATMKALLDSDIGIDIEECDAKGLTALVQSVWSRGTENAQFLLDRGADVNSEGSPDRWMNIAHSAVINDEVEILKFGIKHGARCDLGDDGSTLLHLAAREGKVDILPVLIENGLSQTAVNNKGKTPLHLAAWWGRTETVKYLLDHGSDIEALDDTNRTPLRLAAAEGEAETVTLLCERGADINHKVGNAATIIGDALFNKHVKVAQYLFDHGADKLERSSLLDSVRNAMYINNIVVLRFAIENYDKSIFTDSDLHCTPVHVAAKSGDEEFLEFLFGRDFEIDKKDGLGRTALFYADRFKHKKIVELLLKKGATTAWLFEHDSVSDSPVEGTETDEPFVLIQSTAEPGQKRTLMRAADFEYETLTEVLMDNFEGEVRDLELGQVLCRAVEWDNARMVQLLLDRGVDVNSRNIRGDTALHIACHDNRMEFATLLIAQGADLEARDNQKRTPLLVSRSLPLTKYLIQQGSDIRAISADNRTALHHAINRRGGYRSATPNSSLLEYLISEGLDFNLADENGDTPLHLSCDAHNVAAVKLLLEKGAKVDTQNARGNQPLHRCMTDDIWFLEKVSDHPVAELIELLQQHGSDINARGENGTTLLHRAVNGFGSEIFCEWLLEKGADPMAADNDGITPLLRACLERVGTSCIDTFLNHGIGIQQLEERCRDALNSAMDKEDWEVVDNLLHCGIIPDIHDARLAPLTLHTCIQKMCTHLLDWILNIRKDHIEDRDKFNFTPLAFAADLEQREDVRILLKHGANPNAAAPCTCEVGGHDGHILHSVARSADAHILRALLDAGADPNIRNHKNNTPLMLAAYPRNVECLKILLALPNIDVNAVDDDGDSALLCAIDGSNPRSARILLAREDVDRTIRNVKGFTAEELALTKERVAHVFTDGEESDYSSRVSVREGDGDDYSDD